MTVSIFMSCSGGGTTGTVIEKPPFITTWQTTGPDEEITIPTTGTGYNYTVNWGDSTADSTGVTGDAIHTYTSAGTYTITITGTFPRIYFNNGGDKLKILAIEQWGGIIWTSMSRAFYGCANLEVNATDRPNLSNVTDMRYMFFYAAAFTNHDLSGWAVTQVTDYTNFGTGWGSGNTEPIWP